MPLPSTKLCLCLVYGSTRNNPHEGRASSKFLPCPWVLATTAARTKTVKRVLNWQSRLRHMSTKVKVALRVATEHVLVLKKNTSRAENKKKKAKRDVFFASAELKQSRAGRCGASFIIRGVKTVENDQLKCGDPFLIWTLSKRIPGCVSSRRMKRKGSRSSSTTDSS